MTKLVTVIVIATVIYLTSITILALNSDQTASAYVDDLSITIDGKAMHTLDFATNPSTLGYGSRIADWEYYSPPSSLGLTSRHSEDYALTIIDESLPDWSELKISFRAKMSGLAPSHLQIWVDSDDGYAGSSFSLSLSGRELLSGKCIWSSYSAYDSRYLGSGNHVWYEKGTVDWDWSSWHLVDINVNLSESKMSIGVDGVELCSGPFEHLYGSNLIFKMW
jgi:hypothetical protein